MRCKILIFLTGVSFLFSCNKPDELDFLWAGGYVIAKEECKGSEEEDYWLVSLSYPTNVPQYGDSVLINAAEYKNVVKVRGLAPALRQVGIKVGFDFKTITKDKVVTTGCGVANPTTYSLKELIIINQGEIR